MNSTARTPAGNSSLHGKYKLPTLGLNKYGDVKLIMNHLNPFKVLRSDEQLYMAR